MRESKDLDSLFASLRDPNQFGRANSRDVIRRRSSANESADEPFVVLNIFQIRTIPGGFNSGRTYYVKADSKEDCELISTELRAKAAAARRKAEGTSRFINSQNKVREIYYSAPFQVISSLLIITVRPKTVFDVQIRSSK